MGKTNRNVYKDGSHRQMRCRGDLRGRAASIDQLNEINTVARSRWSAIPNPWDDFAISGLDEIPTIGLRTVSVWHRSFDAPRVLKVADFPDFCREMQESGVTSFALNSGEISATVVLVPQVSIEQVKPICYWGWQLEKVLGINSRSRDSFDSWQQRQKKAHQELLELIAQKPSLWRVQFFSVQAGRIESATLTSQTIKRVSLDRKELVQCGFGVRGRRGNVAWKFWKDSNVDLAGESAIKESVRVVVC